MLYFYKHVSFCPRWVYTPPRQTHPPGQTPPHPQADTPGQTPPGQTPPLRQTPFLGRHSPWADTPWQTHTPNPQADSLPGNPPPGQTPPTPRQTHPPWFIISVFARSTAVADLGFSRGGGANSKRSYYLAIFFSKNCMKLKEFGSWRPP